MKRRSGPRVTPLVLVLLVTLLVGTVAGAAYAANSAGSGAGRDNGNHWGTGGWGTGGWGTGGAIPGVIPSTASSPFAAPDPELGAVADVVKVKSTKHPPQNVKFDGEPMPGGITTGTGTATPGAGEVLVPGVPGYAWRDGCGPTAVGMVVGYYDGNGWADLIPGDATGVTADVNQAIASHGTATAPGNYEDYALPQETSLAIQPDKSELPAGDEHPADSVADFMHTSWSVDSLQYGWSWSNMIAPAFTGYVKLKYASSTPTCTTYAGSGLTWTLVKQQIDAGRPMVFLVDSGGDGSTDHFVTVVGYREINGYPEYGCWDTWNTSLVRWQQFRAMSSSYQWGVWGGYTFTVAGSTTPGPTSTPTPTPPSTPTPTPTPTPADATAPMTQQMGADDAWHIGSVTVTLSATDDASGVAYTEYRLDDGAWTRGTVVNVAAPRKTAVAVSHSLSYRSVDNAGNVETAKMCAINIDTTKPVTNSSTASSAGSAALVLVASDTGSGVSATYYAVDRGSYRPGTSVTLTGTGRHTVKFYSQDVAGNVEATKSVTVTVK